jgi:hypothetical protein
VLLVTAFGAELNPRRIERYPTATCDSAADPVLVDEPVPQMSRVAATAAP